MTYFPRSPFNLGQQGWVCPKCGRVYNPQVTECYHCNTPENTSTSTKLEPNKSNITTMVEVSDITYTPFN